MRLTRLFTCCAEGSALERADAGTGFLLRNWSGRKLPTQMQISDLCRKDQHMSRMQRHAGFSHEISDIDDEIDAIFQQLGLRIYFQVMESSERRTEDGFPPLFQVSTTLQCHHRLALASSEIPSIHSPLQYLLPSLLVNITSLGNCGN